MMNDIMAPDEIMDRAADALDIHGWCRKEMHINTGEMCIAGALYSVMVPEYVNNSDLTMLNSLHKESLSLRSGKNRDSLGSP
jgi:hypothetical protein